MLDGVTGTSDDSQPGGSPPGSMRTALVLVVVGSCLVVSVATVRAIDQPVDAVKLAMKRSAAAAKLVPSPGTRTSRSRRWAARGRSRRREPGRRSAAVPVPRAPCAASPDPTRRLRAAVDDRARTSVTKRT
jgi:hypothetical protein